MPIYEFTCKACDHEFEELLRSMSGAQKVTCPSCGSKTPQRKLSVFAAQQGYTQPTPSGGCGRCGDVNGPCGM